jgi:hypothetical protein
MTYMFIKIFLTSYPQVWIKVYALWINWVYYNKEDWFCNVIFSYGRILLLYMKLEEL